MNEAVLNAVHQNPTCTLVGTLRSPNFRQRNPSAQYSGKDKTRRETYEHLFPTKRNSRVDSMKSTLSSATIDIERGGSGEIATNKCVFHGNLVPVKINQRAQNLFRNFCSQVLKPL